MSKKVLCSAVCVGLMVSGNAYAAGYSCDSYKKYSWCQPGYYMTAADGDDEYYPVVTVGNACTPCPADAIYCAGLTNPPLYTMTLDANGGTPGEYTEFYSSYDKEKWLSESDPSPMYCDYDSTAGGAEMGWCFSPDDGGGPITKLSASYIPTRANHEFMGFGRSANATVNQAVVSADGTLKFNAGSSTGNTKLYAIWRATACEAGKYLSDGTCLTCPSGAYCAGGTYKPAYLVTLDGDAQNNKFYVGEDANGNSVLCEYTEDPSVLESCLSSGAGAISNFDSSYMPSAREHYEFLGYTNVEYGMETDVVINPDGTFSVGYAGEPMTYYGLWRLTSCDPNQYMDGDTCTSCPPAYPSSDGNGDIDTCYLKVEDGYWLASVGGEPVECPAGSYCVGANVYYGQTGGDTLCPEGYRDSENGGANEPEQCMMKVPAGYHLEEYAKTPTACSNGEYKGEHMVGYGNISHCETCPPLDGMAASSKTPRASQANCYIPANTPIMDKTGTYVFSTDCGY